MAEISLKLLINTASFFLAIEPVVFYHNPGHYWYFLQRFQVILGRFNFPVSYYILHDRERGWAFRADFGPWGVAYPRLPRI